MLLAIIPQNSINLPQWANSGHLQRNLSTTHMQIEPQFSMRYKNFLKLEHILPYILGNVFRKLKTEAFITDWFISQKVEKKGSHFVN
jgi:hypothetical protein